jgi:hypothetical protein
MNEEPMTLTGTGYSLTITPEATEQKEKLIAASSEITSVTSNEESAGAGYEMRRLAQMRILIEKSRKEVKDPILKISKQIDQRAAEFLVEVEAEEARLRKLIGDHAIIMLKAKAEAEEAERLAFEAEKAARALADFGGIAAVLDARQALQDKLQASELVTETNVAQKVKFVWDFEVVSIKDLVRLAPEMVDFIPRRRDILVWLKNLEEKEDRNPSDVAAEFGISAAKIPSISTR